MVLWKPFAHKPAVLCQLMCSTEVEELLTVNLTRSAEMTELCLETLWMLLKTRYEGIHPLEIRQGRSLLFLCYFTYIVQQFGYCIYLKAVAVKKSFIYLLQQ